MHFKPHSRPIYKKENKYNKITVLTLDAHWTPGRLGSAVASFYGYPPSRWSVDSLTARPEAASLSLLEENTLLNTSKDEFILV